VVAAPALVGCIGCRVVPRRMQRNRKTALALAVPDLVRGVGYERVAPRGVWKDRKAALAAHPHPGRRGDTHPNAGEEGPGMALRGLDEPQVQIYYANVSERPGDKVQHARVLMEAGAFEGNVCAEPRLGLAIGLSDLAVEAYSSI
jgi:hypothetical protein